MGKVYKKLVESFGYIAEAEPGQRPGGIAFNQDAGTTSGQAAPADTSPGSNTSSYTGDIGNATNDPVKDNPNPTDKPTDKPKSKYNVNPGTRAYQHWLNSHGVKVAIDGKYGPATQAAASTMFEKIKAAKEKDLYEPRFQESQTMLGVGTAHNVKPSPGTSYMWLNSPKYLEAMKKYGYDPKTGNPIPGFQHPNPKLWVGFDSATPGQGSQPTASGDTDTKSKALAISKAISGAGTDEQAVYGVLDTIKNAEEFNQVAASYKSAWGGRRELGQELLGDFSGNDLVMLNQRLMKIGLILNTQGQIVPTTPAAESIELDQIKFLSGL